MPQRCGFAHAGLQPPKRFAASEMHPSSHHASWWPSFTLPGHVILRAGAGSKFGASPPTQSQGSASPPGQSQGSASPPSGSSGNAFARPNGSASPPSQAQSMASPPAQQQVHILQGLRTAFNCVWHTVVMQNPSKSLTGAQGLSWSYAFVNMAD